jgi:hypothetical protein
MMIDAHPRTASESTSHLVVGYPTRRRDALAIDQRRGDRSHATPRCGRSRDRSALFAAAHRDGSAGPVRPWVRPIVFPHLTRRRAPLFTQASGATFPDAHSNPGRRQEDPRPRLTAIRVISTLSDRLVGGDDGLKAQVKAAMQSKHADFAESDLVIGALRPGSSSGAIDARKAYKLVTET